MRFASIFLALTSAWAATAVKHESATAKHNKVLAENNPDDPTGKLLYITEPACGFYRCTVTWPVGSQVAVNWLGPPAGNVAVSLQSNIGGPTYAIVDSMIAISQEGYCDAGYGMGVVAPGHECGRVEFVVPEDWKQMQNYTIVVQSLSDESLAGYTDMITIAAANSSLTVDNPPSGTDVTLLTIPAPTSTNLGASTRYSGKIPDPTAVTNGGAASSSATSSSSSSSSQSRRSTGASSDASTTGSSAAGSSGAQTSGTRASAAASASETGAAPAGALVAQTAAALGLVAAVAVFAL
ncbi:hypothetical protein JCM11641_007094 [Rhodosporidiobolus odoratus]